MVLEWFWSVQRETRSSRDIIELFKVSSKYLQLAVSSWRFCFAGFLVPEKAQPGAYIKKLYGLRKRRKLRSYFLRKYFPLH